MNILRIKLLVKSCCGGAGKIGVKEKSLKPLLSEKEEGIEEQVLGIGRKVDCGN